MVDVVLYMNQDLFNTMDLKETIYIYLLIAEYLIHLNIWNGFGYASNSANLKYQLFILYPSWFDMKCDLCGMDVADNKIKHIHLKGKVKNVCEGCITAVKGFA